MLNAFLVALAVFICVGGAELIGFTMLNRPIVIGPLVGLFLGDVKTGVMIGASLEAVFMGVVNIGGASAAEPGIATAVGTAFAIMLGKGSEVALTLALPIGILGLQIKTFLYIFLVGMFAKKFDQLAAEGKEKQIVFLHYGLWAVNWILYSLVAFLGILFGSDAVSTLMDAIPDVVMNGTDCLRRASSGSRHGNADENAVGQENLYVLFPWICPFCIHEPSADRNRSDRCDRCHLDWHERLQDQSAVYAACGCTGR